MAKLAIASSKCPIPETNSPATIKTNKIPMTWKNFPMLILTPSLNNKTPIPAAVAKPPIAPRVGNNPC